MFAARPPARAPFRSLFSDRRTSALIALTVAGISWGTSVPLSKAAFSGFGPAWLVVFRFALAGLLIVAVARPRLRQVRPVLWLYGAFGYGACVLLQNLGLDRTSVSHAALLLGSVPILVAVLAVLFNGARLGAVAWGGFALSFAGIVVVAGAGGGGATLGGDLIVLGSVTIGAIFTLVQARLLAGQDVLAVTTAQFFASAVAVTPFALTTEGVPVPGQNGLGGAALLAAVALAVIGTVMPFTLFAYGQTGVAPEIAGVFLNLETLVATVIAITLLGEPAGPAQIGGGLALLVGIYIGTIRQSRSGRPAVVAAPSPAPVSVRVPMADDVHRGAVPVSSPVPTRRVAVVAPGLHLVPNALGLGAFDPADPIAAELEDLLERDGRPAFTRAA
ncbi:DMT family transporter [Kineosporia succinea]|uniref:Drug/metabolite transporter (DMT)-like permease n=1 Tax=Kineosporia succinea TaxID=84632 RepID=A0ABT9NYR4_9ACTN|nr:DMT family transporter [Kineosporia succinea]MDP9825566.1 drug/metabolite transporter (DMT)-like permease [Kineosporia succinea]